MPEGQGQSAWLVADPRREHADPFPLPVPLPDRLTDVTGVRRGQAARAVGLVEEAGKPLADLRLRAGADLDPATLGAAEGASDGPAGTAPEVLDRSVGQVDEPGEVLVHVPPGARRRLRGVGHAGCELRAGGHHPVLPGPRVQGEERPGQVLR